MATDKREKEDGKYSIKNIPVTEKNNAVQNDGYTNSIGTRNIMSNNYFSNSNKNNYYIKVLNKEKEVSKQVLKSYKKINEPQPIQKISFNFFDYLLFIFCSKKKII